MRVVYIILAVVLIFFGLGLLGVAATSIAESFQKLETNPRLVVEYVGGDAYNFIIHYTRATGYAVLGLAFLISSFGVFCVVGKIFKLAEDLPVKEKVSDEDDDY